MFSTKRPTLFCIILILSTLAADGRRLEQRSYQQRRNLRQRAPLLRQVDTGTVTDTAENDDGGTETGTGMDTATGTATEPEEEPNSALDTKSAEALIVLKPGQTIDSSRMFKGFFLKALLGGHGAGGASGASGYSNIPYIIVNVPNNITNINQNTLNNTAAAAETTTTTTTPAPAGGRRQAFYQAIPFAEPTQVYEQRRSKPEQNAHPQNFILSPSNQLVPVFLPPEVQALMQSSAFPYAPEQPKRGQLKKKNQKHQKNVNPFSAFANNLRRIQFL